MNIFNRIFKQKPDELRPKFEKWLERINHKEKPDESIVGFNFGLLESPKGYVMYLTGSKTFDKDNDDWAAEVDFAPRSKYFEFGKTFSKDKTWKDIQKCSEELIDYYILSDKFEKSILSKSTAITTGFDDGQLTILYWMKIEAHETIIESDSTLVGSEEEARRANLRILHLTHHHLVKTATANEGWAILYQDPTDQRYWELTFPKSYYHGCGPRKLSYLSNPDATLKYNI